MKITTSEELALNGNFINALLPRSDLAGEQRWEFTILQSLLGGPHLAHRIEGIPRLKEGTDPFIIPHSLKQPRRANQMNGLLRCHIEWGQVHFQASFDHGFSAGSLSVSSGIAVFQTVI
ncbi:MAG: hypothetical protein K9M98_15350 [Cephaloticoccus sp.]|nr:hypothetical protein [Cephaloticoccus sp.]MCF7761876.1 hypothetical protein [Cephaloticoccus sp.]